jgi:glycine dehydrogenase
LAELASANQPAVPLIGMGYHGTHTPPVILRNLLESPGWYTAYTPYQAEVSQGRLEALLNYQQVVIDLTGLELANASLLDEATAAAEAMAMARRVSRSKGQAFFVDALCHPQTIAVVQTRARHLGIHLVVGDPWPTSTAATTCSARCSSTPPPTARIRDLRPAIEAVQAKGGLAAVATDLLALTLLTPPGELGADIALGSAQRFGVPIGYGGPHAAFFATRDAHKRSLPGRIIGVSVDSRGRPALRMALQTREQHIRRDKATSNICTAQVLLANMAGMFAVWHGPEGLTRIATRTHRLTSALAEGLRRAGIEVANDTFFDTLTLDVPGRAHDLLMAARKAGIDLRHVDQDRLGVSLDETSDTALVARLLEILGGGKVDLGALDAEAPGGLPEGLRRTSPFLTHPVFHRYRSETEMLRYLRRLQAKDVALDRAMIPLGSCTMKLNATAEMIPVTFRGFGALHPFAPADQARGYQQIFRDLEAWLKEITGFDAVSLQPNAGSQGEYAGLLVIRAWHEHRGEGRRDVCLIPSSAHGTNPASAIMAGMRVVVVGCDPSGNVDLDDLRLKAERTRPNSRPSWSPTPARTACSRSASRRSARSSTSATVRSTWTAPT